MTGARAKVWSLTGNKQNLSGTVDSPAFLENPLGGLGGANMHMLKRGGI
jgi:hypothetical protein